MGAKGDRLQVWRHRCRDDALDILQTRNKGLLTSACSVYNDR